MKNAKLSLRNSLQVAALSSLLTFSPFRIAAQNSPIPNLNQETWFYFLVRDENGKPVDSELDSFKIYTAELWGAHRLNPNLPTFKVEGSLEFDKSKINIVGCIKPDNQYVQNGFTNDFFSVYSDSDKVNNRFDEKSFSREARINYYYGDLASNGLVAIYKFQPIANDLQQTRIGANISSYATDGDLVYREKAIMEPSDFVIMPNPRKETSLLITKFGQGFPRLFAPGIGKPLTLQRAVNMDGPWEDLYTSRLDGDNPRGTLKFVDYHLNMPERFYKVIVK